MKFPWKEQQLHVLSFNKVYEALKWLLGILVKAAIALVNMLSSFAITYSY